MKIQVYDIEVSPNYFLVGFMDESGIKRQYETITSFTQLQIRSIERIIKFNQLVGFNSNSYDDPILHLMLKGFSVKTIHTYSKHIIEDDIKKWNVYKDLDITKNFESIDLIEVAPGAASLKLYGARLNSKKLQDLPYDPHQILTVDEMLEIKKYNVNDLVTTLDLYTRLKPMLSLRKDIGKKYNIDVMSKSDSQIAESIFRAELTKQDIKITRGNYDKVRYTAPEVVSFYRDDLNQLVNDIEDETILLTDGGSPIMPKWLKDTTINIGSTTYNIGLGGLHSKEKSLVVIPNKNQKLCNVDVASYYPSLIIELGLYPEQLTKAFLKVYKTIYKTRLQAKKDEKDTKLSEELRFDAKVMNNALKITLNGSFGKLGSKYSFLYSPALLLTVTLTGQLYLLMLIEELERNDFKVVSSNTDGVEILMSNSEDAQKLLESIVSNWESKTKMNMEYGQYNALYARDVNNYVAVYPNGKAKAKGAYADPEESTPILSKNIEYPIVFEAIRTYLATGKTMEDTIYECDNICRFTSSRAVKGGAVFYNGKDLPNTDEYNNYIAKQLKKNKALEKRNDEYHKELVLKSEDTIYLGKVVRFYYSMTGRAIFYKTGNKVPKSDGTRPLMELCDDIPKDLDYDKYIELCYEHLQDLGVKI